MNEGLSTAMTYMVGALIVANIGTIGTVAMVAFRAIWWLSKLESKVEETRNMSVRAHRRIDEMRGNNGFQETVGK